MTLGRRYGAEIRDSSAAADTADSEKTKLFLFTIHQKNYNRKQNCTNYKTEALRNSAGPPVGLEGKLPPQSGQKTGTKLTNVALLLIYTLALCRKPLCYTGDIIHEHNSVVFNNIYFYNEKWVSPFTLTVSEFYQHD